MNKIIIDYNFIKEFQLDNIFFNLKEQHYTFPPLNSPEDYGKRILPFRGRIGAIILTHFYNGFFVNMFSTIY